MLILLDIDGVMVLAKPWSPPQLLSDGFYEFSSNAVKYLNKIIDETGASIVLTSSHRTRFDSTEWEEIFRNRGINASIQTLDKVSSNLSRKDEILNWFSNKQTDEDFIIIDDDKSLNALPKQIKKFYIQTKSLIGLNEESFNSAIELLRDSQLVAV